MAHVKNVQSEGDVLLPRAGEKYVSDDGTVSQVLEDVVDVNYSPTDEEIREFAEWIGMKLPEDEDLLWVAREGLKTPLPKEWKPCRTDDGEVYYFNFKTGDSSWEHPMDEIFKKKFEKAKAAARAGVPLSAPPSSHLIFTDSGILQGGASTTAPSGVKKATNSSSAANLANTSLLSASMSASAALPLGGGAGSTSAVQKKQQQQPQQQQRIMSEAERALEDRIRAEVRVAWEKERQEAEQLHHAKLTSLRNLHAQDVREAREKAEVARKAALETAAEERTRTLQQARARCDEKYRTKLNDLEREVEEVKAQIAKVDGEKDRGVGSERAMIEKKAADELDKALRTADTESRARKITRLKDMEAVFFERKKVLQDATVAAPSRAREEAAKALTKKETAMSMALESRRKKLEQERGSIEKEIQSIDSATAAAATSNASSSSASGLADINAAVEQIRVKARAVLEEMQKQNAKEVETLLKEQEHTLKALTLARPPKLQLCSSNGALDEDNKPVQVSVAKVSGTAPAGASDGDGSEALFTQRMAALRTRASKEKQEAMALLRKERDAKLLAARKGTSSSPQTPAAAGGPTPAAEATSFSIQSLKLSNAAAQEAKTGYYKKIQDELAAALNTEMEEVDRASHESLIEKAVKCEMDIYTREVESRRERMQMEFDQKREKVLSEHAIAQAAYERRLEEQKRRQEEELKEMRASMMEDIVAQAVSKEEEKLRSSAAAVLARHKNSYAEEETVIKEEVEEEMQAYERAERERLQREASTASSSAQARTQAADAPISSSGDQLALKTQEDALAQQRTRQQEEWESLEASLRTKQSELSTAQAEASVSTLIPVTAITPGSSSSQATESTVVVRKVPPANSLPRATHEARCKAAEDSYRTQEASVQEELRRWRLKAAELPASVMEERQVPPTVSASALGQANHAAAAAAALNPVSRATSASSVPAALSSHMYSAQHFGTQDALRLWQDQQRRQQSVMAAREEYRENSMREQQQQQQLRVNGNITNSMGCGSFIDTSGATRVAPTSQQQQEKSRELANAVVALNRRLEQLEHGVTRRTTTPSAKPSHIDPHRSASGGHARSHAKVTSDTNAPITDNSVVAKWDRILKQQRKSNISSDI